MIWHCRQRHRCWIWRWKWYRMIIFCMVWVIRLASTPFGSIANSCGQSDFPYAPITAYPAFLEDLEHYDMSQELRDKINFQNAMQLIPRLQGSRARWLSTAMVYELDYNKCRTPYAHGKIYICQRTLQLCIKWIFTANRILLLGSIKITQQTIHLCRVRIYLEPFTGCLPLSRISTVLLETVSPLTLYNYFTDPNVKAR